MRNYLKALIVFALSLVFVFSCVACSTTAKGTSAKLTAAQLAASVVDDETVLDIENTYRVRFVFSYNALVTNDFGRLEHEEAVRTVKSFYVPKNNPVLTTEMKNEVKNLQYHNFTFDKWFTEWNFETQQGVVGTEFDPNMTFTGDVDIYCDRGNLAGLNARWTLVDGVLTISGTGEMFDCLDANELDVPWYKQRDNITKVVIEEGITYVGNNSFNGLSNVVEISLPNTLIKIGASAFQGCSITSLVTPSSLKVIATNAFNGTMINSAILNEGLTTIDSRAFYGSNKMAFVVIPKTVTWIGVSAFHPGTFNGKNVAHSLSRVYYGGTEEQFRNIQIGIDNTWMSEKATKYYYNEASGLLGSYWYWCSADGANIPVQSCFTIKYLYGSSSLLLETIYVPATPVYVDGELQFNDDGTPKLIGTITADHIKTQNSITYHNFGFVGFSGSGKINVGDEITSDITYTCDRGKILSSDGGITWALSSNVLTISVDPTTKSRIETDVESKNSAVGGYILTDFERDALAKYIANGGSIDAAKAQIVSRENASGGLVLTAEEKQAIIDARYDQSLRMWDFVEVSDTTALWTGSVVTVNGSVGVKQIVINDGIKYIGRFAFVNLANPTHVFIPASLDSIHKEAFSGCTAMANIYYMGNITTDCPTLANLDNVRAASYSKIEAPTASVGNYWISYTLEDATEKILAWSLTADGKITVGGDREMYNFTSPDKLPWYGAKSSIKSVAFINSITSISEYAFYNYSNVAEISLPTNLRIIPATAFAGTKLLNDTTQFNMGMLVINGHLLKVNAAMMNMLKIVETNVSIFNIAGGAFSGCTNVEYFFIARTVQHINKGAFNNTGVKYILFDGSAITWGNISSKAGIDTVKAYFKSNTKPIESVYNHLGQEIALKIVDDTYWTKNGGEYVIWGCIHSYVDYVNDNNATCSSNATETAKCEFCNSRDTKEILNSKNETAHNFVTPTGQASDTCINGCGATKEQPALIKED